MISMIKKGLSTFQFLYIGLVHAMGDLFLVLNENCTIIVTGYQAN